MSKTLKTSVLKYWGQAVNKWYANSYTVSIQLAPKGFLLSMIGPVGDQAMVIIPYDELSDVTEGESAVDGMLNALKRELKVPSKIILPKGMM